MKTTRISSWDFTHGPDVLRYRMTPTGLIPSALIIAFVAMACVLSALKFYREATGAMSYFWCGVAAVLSVLCGYGLFHHLRSYRNPYTLDKSKEEFTNGYKPLCHVSEISRVSVIRVEGVAGPDSRIKHPHYKVDFVLNDGENQSSYLTSTSRDVATQYAEVFAKFLNVPSP